MKSTFFTIFNSLIVSLMMFLNGDLSPITFKKYSHKSLYPMNIILKIQLWFRLYMKGFHPSFNLVICIQTVFASREGSFVPIFSIWQVYRKSAKHIFEPIPSSQSMTIEMHMQQQPIANQKQNKQCANYECEMKLGALDIKLKPDEMAQ